MRFDASPMLLGAVSNMVRFKGESQSAAAPVRSFFPETWIWNDIFMGSELSCQS